jgi:hypothetical protein
MSSLYSYCIEQVLVSDLAGCMHASDGAAGRAAALICTVSGVCPLWWLHCTFLVCTKASWHGGCACEDSNELMCVTEQQPYYAPARFG